MKNFGGHPPTLTEGGSIIMNFPTWLASKTWAAHSRIVCKKNSGSPGCDSAILFCFPVRGTKMNRIDKKIIMKKHKILDFFFMLNNFSDVEISDFL